MSFLGVVIQMTNDAHKLSNSLDVSVFHKSSPILCFKSGQFLEVIVYRLNVRIYSPGLGFTVNEVNVQSIYRS